uniref:FLYWCH-type domain-containing protein n=1 Tax=Romanomermis culicivorax TaxID=13658 RepID=A0A915HP92_ROMCU
MNGNFVKSEKNFEKLVHDGYIYTLSKRTADGKHGIWVCEKRGTCKGWVWTEGLTDNVKKTVTAHDHAAQAARSEAIRIVHEMKHRAATTQELPQQILSTAVQNTHANVLAVLPRKESLKHTIRNIPTGRPPRGNSSRHHYHHHISLRKRGEKYQKGDKGDKAGKGDKADKGDKFDKGEKSDKSSYKGNWRASKSPKVASYQNFTSKKALDEKFRAMTCRSRRSRRFVGWFHAAFLVLLVI